MAGIVLKNLYKTYPNGTEAVKALNAEIRDGEFVAVAGPPGAGKSVLLRLIAGLEEPSGGQILLDGKPAPEGAESRDIAMMFQFYGLKPNLSVYDNLAFGLRLRGVSEEETDARVKAAAVELNLSGVLDLKPKKLTAAERRLAGLARAAVRMPAVFLLDDPLAGLNPSEAVKMRAEILRLHKKLGITFVYATRDAGEAMTLGARILILDDGEAKGFDAPERLYDDPDNLFTAAFLGDPPMNFFKAGLSRADGKMYAALGETKIAVPVSGARRLYDEAYIGKEVLLGIRPEDMHGEEVFVAHSPETVITASVQWVERLGFESILYVKADGKENPAAARVDARLKAAAGDEMKFALDGNRMHFFDPDAGYSITGIPHANRIFCELAEQDGQTSVRFGDVKIVLGQDFKDRLVLAKKDARLEIAPDELTERAAFDAAQTVRLQNGEPPDEAEYFEMAADVEFTEKHPLFTAVYTKVAGKRGLVVALLPQDCTFSGGERITLMGKVSSIGLYDIETGNKILAQKPYYASPAAANATGTLKGTVTDTEDMGHYMLYTVALKVGGPASVGSPKSSGILKIGDKVKIFGGQILR